MNHAACTRSDVARYRVYLWLLIAAWTASVAASLAWNVSRQATETRELARQTARALYEKDILYREWAAAKGGVYAVASTLTPPNPHLDVPERDISTPSGRPLTLINPAYMTRQVFELQNQKLGIRGHITSLKPIRPENAPDSWERDALIAFERGQLEQTIVSHTPAGPTVRLMRPLVTTQSCLKCHARQGYRVGDIRGGISVSVPMAGFAAPGYVGSLGIAHAGLWGLGLVGLGLGWRNVRRNVIERERVTAALAQARDDAESASRTKSDFLAHMSHEIRTPMNGVIGMTGLLLDTDLSPEQRQYAQVVRSSADTLLDIINDILDFSKIEAGRIDLEEIPFDVRMAVDDIAELLAVKAHEKRLELAALVAEDVPAVLVGDPTRIRQLLTNLVGNAIKFTSAGEVVVRVSLDRETDTDATVRVTVADTGIGIPPDAIPRLFQSFSQVDSSTTRRFGGTGLGLAICRRLAVRLGGDIGVESRPGQGSTFWFTVVLRKDQVLPSGASSARDAVPTCRTLVIDDNATSRMLLCEQLRAWGAPCAAAADGDEALLLLRAAAAEGHPFRVALVDSEMPGMDGPALGRAIKSDRALDPIALILLTSTARAGDADRASDVGFLGCLRKPVRQAHLHSYLAAAARGTAPEPPGSASSGSAAESPGPGATSPVRVLVAEDNRVNQLVALRILERLKIRADAVANGREVLAALESIPYDLVFMDVQMPEMDGLQVTAAIREAEKRTGRRLPIIAMTAHAMKGDRERCLEAGMDGYVSKPIRAGDVMRAIDEALGSGVHRDLGGREGTRTIAASTALASIDPTCTTEKA
jgi:two-component system, sensor histidine kinase and response regulator